MKKTVLNRFFQWIQAEPKKTHRVLLWACLLQVTILAIQAAAQKMNSGMLVTLNNIMTMVTMAFTLTLAVVYTIGEVKRDSLRGEIYLLVMFCLFTTCFLDCCVLFLENSSRPPEGWLTGFRCASTVTTELQRLLFGYLIQTYLDLPPEKDRALERLNLTSGLLYILAVLLSFTLGGPMTWLGVDGFSLVSVYYLVWIVIYLWLLLFRRKDRQEGYLLLILGVMGLTAVPLDLMMEKTAYGDKTAWIYGMMPFVSYFLVFCDEFTKQRRQIAEEELARQQSALKVLSMQINPHFICNTLATIDALIPARPEDARKLIRDFSAMLRDDYMDINAPALIPIGEELEHLKHYAAIQQVRFPNLRIQYDVRCGSFLLPRLTIQPLVENAVIHGIRPRRKSAGTVTVTVFERETEYVILVSDDGVGFSTAQEEGEKHIGIANVRKRLSLFCQGTLEIQSDPGKGTVCEARVPKERKLETAERTPRSRLA